MPVSFCFFTADESSPLIDVGDEKTAPSQGIFYISKADLYAAHNVAQVGVKGGAAAVSHLLFSTF